MTRYFGSATGDTSYGYFSGISGLPPTSTLDRIDFSNDTGTASLKGNLDTTYGNAVYGTGSASAAANANP